MICKSCRSGANVSALLAEEPNEALRDDLAKVVDQRHGSCLGCPCQHRGTRHERRPAGHDPRPAALVTSPTLSATPPIRRP